MKAVEPCSPSRQTICAPLESPPLHGVAVPVQEGARNPAEQRMRGQFLRSHFFVLGPRERVGHYGAVRQGAGGARHHALAARHARRLAHRVVQIEGDLRRVAFAHAAQHLVVPDLVAAAYAAIAEDAGIAVNADQHRRIVAGATCRPGRKARMLQAQAAGERFQLVLARLADLDVPAARGAVVGQQKLDECFHRRADPLASEDRRDLHARLDHPLAGRRQSRRPFDFHDAHPADRRRRHVLAMTEGRNRILPAERLDVQLMGGVVDRRPRDGDGAARGVGPRPHHPRDLHGVAVDADVDQTLRLQLRIVAADRDELIADQVVEFQRLEGRHAVTPFDVCGDLRGNTAAR